MSAPLASGAELRAGAAHVFVDDLEQPVLGDDDRFHLVKVLRLRAGEVVTVSDGMGSWRTCSFQTGGGLEVTGDPRTEPASFPPLTVGFALVKGDRPEWVVQKLTEVGIDRIVPVRCARSVVVWEGDRRVKALERLRRVARAAAMQCRRVRLPHVDAPLDLADLVRQEPAVRLAEPGGGPVVADGVMVVVGPEGGFTPEELALVDHVDPHRGRVGLPGGVLRSETAAVALGVLLSAARDILPAP